MPGVMFISGIYWRLTSEEGTEMDIFTRKTEDIEKKQKFFL